MRFFSAHVCNGRIVLDEPTDLPEGTHLELVSTDSVMWLVPPGEAPAPARAVFAQELEASFAEEDAGQLVDAADVLADLRTRG